MEEIILSKKVDKNVPKDKWIASLSNGETIFEDQARDMLSAWRRLGTYVKENKLAITNMRLQIGGKLVELPAHQDGYIVKGKIQSTGSWSRLNVCIGYAQGGRAMVHEVSSDGGSHTVYCEDPGEPFTIYRHDKKDTHE